MVFPIAARFPVEDFQQSKPLRSLDFGSDWSMSCWTQPPKKMDVFQAEEHQNNSRKATLQTHKATKQLQKLLVMCIFC